MLSAPSSANWADSQNSRLRRVKWPMLETAVIGTNTVSINAELNNIGMPAGQTLSCTARYRAYNNAPCNSPSAMRSRQDDVLMGVSRLSSATDWAVGMSGDK